MIPPMIIMLWEILDIYELWNEFVTNLLGASFFHFALCIW